MLYAIIGRDHPGSLDKRLSVRPEHLARLQALQEEGRLIVAGPFPAIDSNDPGNAGFTGSLIVAEFPSLEDAQSWAQADPYVAAYMPTPKSSRSARFSLHE
ncbi:YciI family protein [Paludibacterium denitrificans]|uniref:YciI family protein n=1 Tax=Paludibacterium denitrificans TaxID=2675226 RepID=UPI00406BD0F4